jgi:hypothetical protein
LLSGGEEAGRGHRLKSAPGREVFTYLRYVEIHPAKAPGLVPVGALRSGDPITDVNGGGQHYIVLESKTLGEGCVVLELESKANDQLRVIEATFPADYVMSLTPRHPIL